VRWRWRWAGFRTVATVILPRRVAGNPDRIVISMGRAAGETARSSSRRRFPSGRWASRRVLSQPRRRFPGICITVHGHEAVEELRHVQFGKAATWC
jgi:hypothetical protein